MDSKAKERKEQRKEQQRARVERYLGGALELGKAILASPIAAGLTGYMAVSLAQELKKADGEPYLPSNTAAVLKGVAAGYPLGGFAGLAVGAVVSGSEIKQSAESLIPALPQLTLPDTSWQSWLQGAWNPFKS